MVYGYATCSVYCDTMITFNTLLTNCASVMTPWPSTSIDQCLQSSIAIASSECSHTLCTATNFTCNTVKLPKI